MEVVDFSELEEQELEAKEKIGELVKKGVLDFASVSGNFSEYSFSERFSDSYNLFKKLLSGRIDGHENRIVAAMALSLGKLTCSKVGESSFETQKRSEDYGYVLGMLWNGDISQKSIVLRPEEELALETYQRELQEMPSEDELKGNIMDSLTDEAMGEVSGNLKRETNQEGLKKLNTCKYGPRCMEKAGDIIMTSYSALNFIVNNVCESCDYHKKEKRIFEMF